MLPVRFPVLPPVATPPVAPATGDAAAPQGGNSFGALLGSLLSQVNQQQLGAQAAERSLATGQARDVGQVMVISEQARLSLDLTIAVRNKLLEAYQEIMRMPL